MEQKTQAFNVVVNALNLANQKGAFNLQDAKTVFDALSILAPDYPQPEAEAAPATAEAPAA